MVGGTPTHAGGLVVGVLDLQGDVREHAAVLSALGCAVRAVKRPDDLAGVVGLVLPGGESTTLSMLLESTGLFAAVEVAAARGLPILGTCAGLVLVARQVLDGRSDQHTFGLVDVVVRRNGYGRQLQSFESELDVEGGLASEADGPPLPAVFIRAPLVVSAGESVEVLARLDGVPVLVRQGPVVATSFHPELTGDRRVHQMFVDMCWAEVHRQDRGLEGITCAATSSPSPVPIVSASSPPSPG